MTGWSGAAAACAHTREGEQGGSLHGVADGGGEGAAEELQQQQGGQDTKAPEPPPPAAHEHRQQLAKHDAQLPISKGVLKAGSEDRRGQSGPQHSTSPETL